MDVADLQLIDNVAKLGSFSAAAASQRLSQPAVSARIAALERTVGVSLFVRDSRGARLTPAGDRYLGYVRRSLRLLAEAARAAAAEDSEPVFTVGVPASYAPALTPPLLAAVCDRPLAVRTGHSNQLRADVLDGRLDVAVVTAGAVPAGLVNRHLADTSLVALAAQRRPADREHYAVHSWDQGVDAVVSELLGRGIPRTHISIVSPAATALSLAIHHHAIAVVPKLSATAELASGALKIQDQALSHLTARLEWIHPARADHIHYLDNLTVTVTANLNASD
jgi:DNA-binding transcriptional LysR family regulator